MPSSHDLFGCAGLKKSEYCILNKQYNKVEYEKLRKEIVAQMNAVPYKDKTGNIYRYGEYFPIELSYFGYNETVANEYFPMTEKEAAAKGFGW